MKITRMISVELELWQELKNRSVNVSGLCNELLTGWLKEQQQVTPEERAKRIKTLEVQIEAMDKLEAIEKGEF